MRPSAKARARLFPVFFLFFLIVVFVYPVHADELTVSPSEPSYGLGATVKVSGKLTLGGMPVPNGLVAVEVQDSLRNVRFIRVVKTGVSPNPWKVKIADFISCDSQGNQVGNFLRGTNAYFEITVESLDSIERDIVVALDLFDALGVSLSVQYSKFSLPPAKQFTILTSMPIPDDAFLGQSICSASVLTDLPREDGYPYCGEKCVEFAITGVGPEVPIGSSVLSAVGSNGLYNLSFKLPSVAALGDYLVSARARYNAEGKAVFDYFWLLTDFDRNGVVDIVDISFVARAFGTAVGDPDYKQVADINNDNVVDIVDVSYVAKDFEKEMRV